MVKSHDSNFRIITSIFWVSKYLGILRCHPCSHTLEPGHEKTYLLSYANNKGADQPAHPRSLINAFVVHCLDSVMFLVSVTKISSLMLASVAEQANLSLTWSETQKDMFSHDEAHLLLRRHLCVAVTVRILCHTMIGGGIFKVLKKDPKLSLKYARNLYLYIYIYIALQLTSGHPSVIKGVIPLFLAVDGAGTM